MNRAETYFSTLGIDLDAEILKILKYLPVIFFDKIEMKELDVTVQSDSVSNWAILPFYNWEILSFRNGKMDKSLTQDITITEPVIEELSTIEYDDFWFCHYGDRFVVPRFDHCYNVNIIYNYCAKTIANLKELPKIEFQNILMNLKIKDQNQVFKGIERLKLLYPNLTAENTIRPEFKALNQSSEGFTL